MGGLVLDRSDSEKIGRLLQAVEQIQEDFKEERRAARESRANIHRRLDEQAYDITKLRTDLMAAGQIQAQVRNELQEVRKTVDENHEAILPDIEEFRRMKTLGRGFVWLLGFGGLSVGATIAYLSENLAAIIRHWLKI